MPIRALLVEDSRTVLERLREALTADPEIVVVGEATDGRRAIELCRELRPNVITMDMMLPVMSGLAATEFIMAHHPTPILIVSSSTNRGELFKTYEALAAGALDVLEKPRGDESDGDWDRRLIAAVKLVSRIRVITHPRARLSRLSPTAPVRPSGEARAGAAQSFAIVGVGASTGGPAAMVDLLRALPPTFQLPLLFVLHIGEPFGVAFADWLDGQTERRVRYPKDGEPVAAAIGQAIMAPPDWHLVVERRCLRLTRAPARHSCRPSVDVLFESIAQEYGADAAACLLTGMGRDGASGLLALRAAGALTIAQDEATSVVYGMPREAVVLGAAERVLPLGEIGPALVALAGTRERC